MALLPPERRFRVFSDGLADRVCLYAMRNVSATDTVDLSEDFSVVKRAVFLGTTVAGAASAGVSGTIVTVPTGATNDAAWLLAWGASA
jgi:hypothetical protein